MGKYFAAVFLVATACTIGSTARGADTPAPPRTPDYSQQWSNRVKPTRVVVYKTVDGRQLELHVFDPPERNADDRRPCHLTIHGGGWVAGTPKTMYCVADYFAQRGWVGISLRYRLADKDDGATVWNCIKDGRSAVRFLRANAADLGIDPERIVVSGRSAGGHVAVGTALFDDVNETSDDLNVSCTPQALVLYFPVIDTSTKGYGHDLLGDHWRELSPVDRVRSKLPPTLVFHGKRDTITPFAGAKAFEEAMRVAGNRCVLVSDERGSHGYMMRTDALFNDAMQRSIDFLAEAGLSSPGR